MISLVITISSPLLFVLDTLGIYFHIAFIICKSHLSIFNHRIFYDLYILIIYQFLYASVAIILLFFKLINELFAVVKSFRRLPKF